MQQVAGRLSALSIALLATCPDALTQPDAVGASSGPGLDAAGEPAAPRLVAQRLATHQSSASSLEPIDLSAIPPIIVDIENVELDAIHSGIVCRRVRVIYSLVPRTFCATREQLLARQDRSNRERVSRDIQALKEIRRYQMRDQINLKLNTQH